MGMRKQLLILLLLIGTLSFGQTPLHKLTAKKAAGGGGGGNSYPTFVSETETAWDNSTSPKTTASISVQSGDVIVAFAANTDNSSGDIAVSGGSLTWTERQHELQSGYCEAWLWTTTATSTTSITVTFTQTGTASFFGGNVIVFRDATGYDNSAKTFNASGAPSLNITPTASNCAIVVFIADWTASTAARTWLTVNGYTPSSGNGLEVTYYSNGNDYGVYGSYYIDAGAGGAAKTVGLSAPTGLKYVIVAASIQGN